MTMTKTTLLQPTGRKHINEVKPFIEKGEVVLFDMYSQGEWVGSKRTLKQVLEEDDNYRKNSLSGITKEKI